jgi:hypothetical protein
VRERVRRVCSLKSACLRVRARMLFLRVVTDWEGVCMSACGRVLKSVFWERVFLECAGECGRV